MPVRRQDGGIAFPVLRVHARQQGRQFGERVGAVQRQPDQFVPEGGALPRGRIPVGERGDPTRRVHGGGAPRAGEPDRRGRRPHQSAVARGAPGGPKVLGGGRVPGQAAGQYVLGLEPDVLGVGRRPPLEPREEVRRVQAAAIQQ